MIRTDRQPAEADREPLHLASFEPVTLAELNRVALLDRVEVKYLLPIPLLDDVLLSLRANYAALTISGQQREPLSHALF